LAVLLSAWVDYFTATASVVAVLAAGGGALIAVYYGRKADVRVEGAPSHTFGDRLLLEVRATVRAVGVFRLDLAECSLTVTESLLTERGLHDGKKWQEETVFGSSFVEAGEALRTSVVFEVGAPDGSLVGWRVVLGVAVNRRFQGKRQWTWGDRIFVPRVRASQL